MEKLSPVADTAALGAAFFVPWAWEKSRSNEEKVYSIAMWLLRLAEKQNP